MHQSHSLSLSLVPLNDDYDEYILLFLLLPKFIILLLLFFSILFVYFHISYFLT